MNLYLQFLTQNQSAAAINLVKMPALLVGRDEICGRVKISAGGQITSFDCSNIEKLVSQLASARLNGVEITYQVTALDIGAKEAPVNLLAAVFTPSPTCSLWLPSKDFTVSDADGRARRMNAWKDEQCLAGFGISKKPCILEVALEIEYSDSTDQLLDDCAERLANRLASQFPDLNVFGCCDIGGQELFVRLEVGVLMVDKIRVIARTLPTLYSYLGEKFDDLHPIIFGSKRLCVNLSAALGRDAKLIENPRASDFAVVRVDCESIEDSGRLRAKECLLPKQ